MSAPLAHCLKLLTCLFTISSLMLLAGCDSASETAPSSARSAASATEPKTKIGTVKREPRAATAATANRAAAAKAASATAAKANPATDESDLQGPDPKVVVTGRVNLVDGSPASSATIQLMGYEVHEGGFTQVTVGETTASEDGSYRVVGRGTRSHSLKADRQGSSGAIASLETESSFFSLDTPIPQLRRYKKDITLGAAAEIRGRVIDEHDKPIAGVTVGFTGGVLDEKGNTRSADGLATTTATGEFIIADIAPGERTLTATSDNHVPATQLATAPTTEGLTIRMASAGANVNGYVLLKNSSTPVTSATVTLMFVNQEQKKGIGYQPFKGTTDNFGAYQIPRLPAGTYRISAIAEDPNLGLVPSDHPNGMSVELADRETTEVNLVMYGGITVTGTVFDKETSEPIADARIKSTNYGMRRSEKSTTSTADGSYQLVGVFPQSNGYASLTVTKPGYEIAGDRWNRGSVALQADPDEALAYKDVPMMRTVTISGTVKTRDGVPIPTAKVKSWEQQGGSRSDREPGTPVRPDGTYELEVPRFSSLRVMAEAPSYASDFSEVAVIGAESVKDVDIVLEPGATLSGVVVDPNDRPIASAAVSITRSVQIGSYGLSQNLSDITTDADGKFTVANLPKSVRAKASKKGFAPSKQEELTLEPGGAKSDTVLALRPPHFISGRVLTAAGEGMPDVQVQAYSSEPNESSSGNTTSDKQGNYRIEDLAETVYRMHAWGRNGGQSKQLENIRVDRTDVDIVFDDEDTVTLIGRVVDDKSGAPIKNFTVSGIGTAKYDRNAGKFSVSGMRTGTNYVGNIEAQGYPTTSISVYTPKEKVPFEKEFRIGFGGTVTGRVVRKGTGDPLPNVQLIAWGGRDSYMMQQSAPAASTKSGEDGKFTLKPVAAGNFQIAVRPEAPLASSMKTGEVKNEETTDLGDIEVGGGGNINGRVLRGEAGVPNVKITANNWQAQVRKEATTNAEGAFSFASLTPGDYSVSASPFNAQKSVQIADEETKDVVIRLGSAKLKGRVTRGGRPVAASVSLNYTGGESEYRNARSDAEGNYLFEDLPPGAVTATAQLQSDYQTRKAADLTIVDGAEATQDFQLPDGRMTGIVLDASGSPVPVANVSLTVTSTGSNTDMFANRSGRTTKTDSTGKFEYEGLEAGVYSVTATKDGAGMATKGNIAVTDQAPGYAELRLGQDGGTLESVVYDIADSKPIQRAWCYLNGPDGAVSHTSTRDANGVMKIENLPPGTYQVQVSAWSYSVNEKSVEIRKGETTRIEDVLYGAGSMQWTIQTKAGQGIAGAEVQMSPTDAASIEQPRSGKTDNKGIFIARGLAPGTYAAVAQLPSGATVSQQFTIKAASHDPKVTTVD